MKKFGAIVFAVTALVLAIGCGGGQKGLELKVGDELVVAERFERVRFEAHYGPNAREVSSTDGAFIDLPAGTVLRVEVTPRREAPVFEVVPVKASVVDEDGTPREVTDAEELRDMFIQERYIRHDFLYYTISIPADSLGTRVKMVGK